MVGQTLGHYEILEPLGVGGMGEVYRARDTKLDRDVAIKVLPEDLALDADRLARFEREAKLLASLNHANIATIYGLEDAGDQRFIIMEVVEGETLQKRLAGSGRVEVDEALEIARQIAEALEAAHDNGVIHRDLKPANIKITPQGNVKVLDFGLAKAYEANGSPSRISLDLSHSPTTPAATSTGVIMGTAAYMSPEQASGKPLDKRTDNWAFGCVMYEMLTGTRAFAGDSASEIIAAILKEEPDWDSLPRATPKRLRRLLERCLQKDPRLRLRDAGDAWIELGEVIPGASDREEDALQSPVGAHRITRFAAVALIVVVSVLAGTAIGGFLRSVPPPGRTMRLAIALPPGDRFAVAGQRPIAISPDGARLAYVANQQLYLREMDQLEARPIRGTQGLGMLRGGGPFFSADGQWLAFWTDGKLMKVSVGGGDPVKLADAISPRGASWVADSTILYSRGPRGIWKVPTGGGEAELLVALQGTETAYGPQLLPGDGWILYTLAQRGATRWDQSEIVVESLDTGDRMTVAGPGRDARYLPTGHLVYVRGGTLFAQVFDPEELAVRGEPVPMVEGIASGIPGSAHFSVSAVGSLVYVPGPKEAAARILVWVSEDGSEEPLGADPLPYDVPRVSPAGDRVAVQIDAVEGAEIHVYDLRRDKLTRLTFDPAYDYNPLWTLDGGSVVFGSSRDGGGLFSKAADGTGAIQHIIASPNTPRPQSWVPSVGRLVFYEDAARGGSYTVGLDDPKGVQSLLVTPFLDSHVEVSPDGRWIAYSSDELGELDVYVRPFPNVDDGKWKISTGGGIEPVWSPDGRKLFFRKGNSMLVVAVETKPTFRPGNPAILFEGDYLDLGPGRQYDLAPDGRFLMLKTGARNAGLPRIVVVENWFEELNRLVPTGR